MKTTNQKKWPVAIKTIVLAMAGAGLVSLPYMASANPTGGQVVAGNVTIRQESASKLGITQTTDKGIIDWQKYSIGANESVQYYQPSASSVTLNRVVGQDPSQILGKLSANGQIFLVNPNGIYFGKNAQIDVAGLVASTHNIRNEDFLVGNYSFNIPGKPGAAVINEGTIRIADTGVSAFVAPSVANHGVIVARLGKVGLAAANGFTLDFHGDQLLSFLVTEEVAKTAFDMDGKQLTSFVENSGRIEAQGGYVLLTAKAAESAIHGVINQSGVIEATTVGTRHGEIILNAGKGSLEVSGTLDASAPNGGDGGFIETSGAQVSIVANTQINTAASSGKNGLWLIDPLDITINGSMATAIISALQHGDVTITTSGNNTPGTTAVETAGSGDIFVNAAIGWSANKFTLVAYRNININNSLIGSGSAQLAFQYGQGSSNGSGTDYFLNNGAQVTLPSGENFSTKQGSAGGIIPFTVITSLGAANSTTAQDLQGMNGALNRNYVLGSDIDASATRSWNGGVGFKPIGQLAATFTGKLDGLGHQISDLFINRPNESEVGFIGSMTNSTVRNIGLNNVDITAGERIGGVAGTLRWGSTLQNVYATGAITGVSTGVINGQPSNAGAIGGLVGVATPYYYGGNTWCASCINIDTSYANVNVTGNTSLGGIAGVIDQTNIRNSYATGNITSTNTVSSATGGLVGYLFSSNVINSYSAGRVQGGNSYVGGLIGWKNRTISTTNYWDIDTSHQSTSFGGTGKTTAQMQQQATYTGWDFVNIWGMSPSGYPVLRNSPKLVAVVSPPPITPPVTPPVVVPPPQPVTPQPPASNPPPTVLSATYIPDAGRYAVYVASAVADTNTLTNGNNEHKALSKAIYVTDKLVEAAGDRALEQIGNGIYAMVFQNGAIATWFGDKAASRLRGGLPLFAKKLNNELNTLEAKGLASGLIKSALIGMLTDEIKLALNEAVDENIANDVGRAIAREEIGFVVDAATAAADTFLDATSGGVSLGKSMASFQLAFTIQLAILSTKEVYKTGGALVDIYQERNVRIDAACDNVVNLASNYEKQRTARWGGDTEGAEGYSKLISRHRLTDPVGESYGLKGNVTGRLLGDLSQALFFKSSGNYPGALEIIEKVKRDAAEQDFAEHPFGDTPWQKSYTDYVGEIISRMKLENSPDYDNVFPSSVRG